MSHAVRHAQSIGRQIAEAAAVVAPARRDQAGGREETPPRQNRPARGRILAIVVLVSRHVARLQPPGFNVAQDARPKLHAIAERQRIGMRRTLLGTRQHVQSAQHHLAPAPRYHRAKFKRPLRERQMHRDPHNFRHGLAGRRPRQQVLVPILQTPVRRTLSPQNWSAPATASAHACRSSRWHPWHRNGLIMRHSAAQPAQQRQHPRQDVAPAASLKASNASEAVLATGRRLSWGNTLHHKVLCVNRYKAELSVPRLPAWILP